MGLGLGPCDSDPDLEWNTNFSESDSEGGDSNAALIGRYSSGKLNDLDSHLGKGSAELG